MMAKQKTVLGVLFGSFGGKAYLYTAQTGILKSTPLSVVTYRYRKNQDLHHRVLKQHFLPAQLHWCYYPMILSLILSWVFIDNTYGVKFNTPVFAVDGEEVR